MPPRVPLHVMPAPARMPKCRKKSWQNSVRSSDRNGGRAAERSPVPTGRRAMSASQGLRAPK